LAIGGGGSGDASSVDNIEANEEGNVTLTRFYQTLDEAIADLINIPENGRVLIPSEEVNLINWGQIGGDILNQADLQAALAEKTSLDEEDRWHFLNDFNVGGVDTYALED
jgi:hypothetical protein